LHAPAADQTQPHAQLSVLTQNTHAEFAAQTFTQCTGLGCEKSTRLSLGWSVVHLLSCRRHCCCQQHRTTSACLRLSLPCLPQPPRLPAPCP
jgi:hypothetical protein